MPPICYIGCFVEYHEYPEYLFQNIQLKTACLDLCSFGKQIVYILFLFCVFYESYKYTVWTKTQKNYFRIVISLLHILQQVIPLISLLVAGFFLLTSIFF